MRFLLLLFLHLLVKVSNQRIEFPSVILFVLIDDNLCLLKPIHNDILHLAEDIIVLPHFLVFVFVKIFLFDDVSDKFIDRFLSDFLLEAVEFVFHGGLSKIFVLFEPHHD
jgi:hypothetical protein